MTNSDNNNKNTGVRGHTLYDTMNKRGMQSIYVF